MKRVIFILIASFIGMQNAVAGYQFLYAGVAPVYSLTNVDWQNADTNANTNPEANGRDVINDTHTNTQVGAFIGYGVLLDRIYLGVEGGTQFGQRKAASQTLDYNTQLPLSNQVTMSSIYTVDLRPGFVLGDKNSLLYAIVGLNSSSFEAEQTNDTGAIVQASGSTRTNGIRVGAGYNLGLGKYFMARVEYVFTKFSGFQFSDTFPDGSETHTWEVNPYSNEINFGLAVIFNL